MGLGGWEGVLVAVAVFLGSGLCEIGGGWLVWKWRRDGWNIAFFFLGCLILIAYGILPTFQEADFGRTYAAYGGFFIILALLWGWALDGNRPDLWDGIGAALAVAGACVIFFVPRPQSVEAPPPPPTLPSYSSPTPPSPPSAPMILGPAPFSTPNSPGGNLSPPMAAAPLPPGTLHAPASPGTLNAPASGVSSGQHSDATQLPVAPGDTSVPPGQGLISHSQMQSVQETPIHSIVVDVPRHQPLLEPAVSLAPT